MTSSRGIPCGKRSSGANVFLKKEGNEGEEGLLQQRNPNLISKGGQGLGGCGIVANVWGIDSKSCHMACLLCAFTRGRPMFLISLSPREKRSQILTVEHFAYTNYCRETRHRLMNTSQLDAPVVGSISGSWSWNNSSWLWSVSKPGVGPRLHVDSPSAC